MGLADQGNFAVKSVAIVQPQVVPNWLGADGKKEPLFLTPTMRRRQSGLEPLYKKSIAELWVPAATPTAANAMRNAMTKPTVGILGLTCSLKRTADGCGVLFKLPQRSMPELVLRLAAYD